MLSKRRKLIAVYTAASVSLVAAALVALLLLREKPKPYAPGGDVDGITSELARGMPAGYQPIVYTDATAQAGVQLRHFQQERTTQLPEDMGSGAAWGDFDNDGLLDLYVCDIAGPLTWSEPQMAASPGGNRLYRNAGGGRFADVTERSGTGFKGLSMGAAWADYDNDGFLDLAVSAYGRLLLYRNQGNGTFEDVSASSGFNRFKGFWTGISWADYNRDGFPDLYVCGYVQYKYQPELANTASRQYEAVIPFMLNPSSYQPERNLLLRNNGKGRFTDEAPRAGVANPSGRSLSAAWADFDGDGWSDIYVANDISDNVMYRNLGNGRFEDISHPAWVADYRGAMGLGVGDYDRDGDLDIYVTHWIAQENAFYWNLRFSKGQPGKAGPLKFTDIADMVGLGQITLGTVGWGTSFLDADNDGQLDIFAANGSTFQEESNPRRLKPMLNQLFWQKSPEEGFFEVGPAVGAAFRQPHVSRGAAFADYDSDGDMDILVVNHQEAPLLLRNDTPRRNNWITVRVQPSHGPRNSFGVGVEITCGGVRQYQEIGSQSSYLSQNAIEAHFGLGQSKTVDSVKVRYPGGAVREQKQVPANQAILVAE